MTTILIKASSTKKTITAAAVMLIASTVTLAAAPMDNRYSSINEDTSADIGAYNDAESTAARQEPQPTQLPELSSLQDVASLSITLPQIEYFSTDNGVPVTFVHSPTLPIVDVDLRFNAGSARDPAIRSDGFGIAYMTAAMLSQGSGTLDEDAFNEQVEMLGIVLDTQAYKDMFVVSLRSLVDAEHLQPASHLFNQMLTEPHFDSRTLERNKARLLLGLQQQQQDPSRIAEIAFNQALFGQQPTEQHPYAHPSTGTLESVPSIQETDLIAFKDRFLVAGNANLSITGDLSLTAAKQLANQITQGLPQGAPAPALPEPSSPMPTRIHIPFDSTQTTVIMGQLGYARSGDTPQMQQQSNFTIGNDILAGSGFNARLMTEIRKQRGLTYGIYGSMQPMQTTGAYRIQFSTRNDKVDEAITATLATIQQTLDGGVSSQELALTKNNLAYSFPMSYASNAGINAMLAMMGFYGLPENYWSDYLQRIDNASLENVNHSLRQTLNPENFIIVTVGQQADLVSK